MATKTFTNKQKEIVARKLGYDGPMSGFEKFVKSDPAIERKLNMLTTKFMARGGAVRKFAEGGSVTRQQVIDSYVNTLGRTPGKEEVDYWLGYSKTNNAEQTANAFLAGAQQELAQKKSTPKPAATPTSTQTLNIKAPTTSNVTLTPAAGTTVGTTTPTLTTPTTTATTTQVGPPTPTTPVTPTTTPTLTPTLQPDAGPKQTTVATTTPAAPKASVDRGTVVESYSKFLNRTPSEEEINFWTNYSKNNSAEQTANAFLASAQPEIEGIVRQGYASALNRNPSQEEVNFWKDYTLREGAVQAANAFNVGAQQETEQAGGAGGGQQQATAANVSDDQVVQSYTQFLNRTPSQEEINFWTNYSKNNSAEQTANAFLEGARSEIEGIILQGYASKLNRTPSQEDVDFWVNYTLREGAVQAANAWQIGADKELKAIKDGKKDETEEERQRRIDEAIRAAQEDARRRAEEEAAKRGQTGGAKDVTTINLGGGEGLVFGIPSVPGKPGIPSMDVAKIGASTAGQEIGAPNLLTPIAAQFTQAGAPAQVTSPTATAAPQIDAVKTQSAVDTAVAGNQAITGTLSSSAQAAAAEVNPAETALKDLEAAKLANPREVAGVPERTLQAGELVSGPAVNMAQVDAALNKAEAATAAVKPEMTVQGQLDKLLADFDSGNPPAWAASSMRNANAVMAARGLGASSLAGQAIIQATLEAAIPIAAQDAQTVTALELQNLSNRQQVAVLVAQQRAAFLGQEFDQAFQTRVVNAARVADIANLNFTAEQTIAIENARLAQTADLANLSNEQAVIMARAAQIANLESANLNNRQQAALQNAQAFLQLDLTNLNNQQQTALFNAEKVIQSIFTDTAAQNAARQFNAASEIQVQQFYDSLATQVSQFNVTQKNAMEQFNVSQENALSQFNAQQSNAMQQFNAQNRLIVDQSNAEWRRQIATIDTAAQNTANQFEAQAGLQINMAEYNNMWQTVRDTMEYAFKASQGYLDRQNTLAVAVLQKEAALEAAKYEALGALSARVLGDSGGISGITSSISGGIKSIKDVLGIGSAVVINAGQYDMSFLGDADIQGGYDFYGNPINDQNYIDYMTNYWGGSD